MAEQARQPSTRRRDLENFPVRTGGVGQGEETSPDREKRDLLSAAAADTTTTTTTTTTPPPVVSGQEPLIGVVDESLEIILQRLRFRGARAFLWRYRDDLGAVRRAIEELEDARDEEAWSPGSARIRNPGGFIRWRVKEEAGDGRP